MDLLHPLPKKAFSFPLLSSLLFSSSFVSASVSNSKALSTQEQCIEDHFSALLRLKQSFDFSAEYTMTRLPSWNPDNRDCCSWEGITCDGATGHVTSLDLSELGISGQIDFVSLFRLQSLQKLNLAYNRFDASPFPSGFEQLTNLTHLNLSWLNFYGQIPLEISGFITLVSLDLSFNSHFINDSYSEYLKLKNPSIGVLFQNLSSLRELHLDWVDISEEGSKWGLALSSALPLLHKLSLRHCHLSGPIHPSLSNLHFLSELYLSRNNLSSAIPKSIFRLPNLQTLDVGYNPLLTGEIPPNSTIRQLYLSNTGFCSNLQDSYGNFTLLTTLALSSCYPGGPFPSWLVKLNNLMYLYLSSNGFSGPLPSSLANLHNLITLDLSSNGFSGPLPSSFGNLSNLVHLHLYTNGFNGPLPSSLANLHNLVTLDLSFNNFSGPLPSSFGNLSNLVALRLSSNGFSGQLPSSLANLSNLISLDVSYNDFSGPLPSSLPNLSNLIILSLSSNGFNSPIPSSYGNKFQSLQGLSVYHNSLNGTIPSSLFSLPSLRSLDFSQNQLSGQLEDFQNASTSLLQGIILRNNKLWGPIPRSIFELTKLGYLALGSNNFSGPIPSLHGNELQNVNYLELSGNSLSGTIPSSLFSLPSLQNLYLSGNQFSGQLGDFHNASSSLLYGMYLDNNKLEGPIHLGSLFQKLTKLSYLSLSDNNFSVVGSNSIFLSFSQIIYLSLRSCDISKFPNILRNQLRMEHLDLSSNKINGEIPFWIWNVGNESLLYLNLSHNALERLEQLSPHLSLSSLHYLDLSFNKLEGSIPILPVLSTTFSLSSLTFLDLSFNKLEGSISIPPPSTTFYSLSSNNFIGEVPSLICNCTALQVLDLSNNSLNGLIPPCLGEISDALTVLNLNGNTFHGTLHQAFKEGCTLETLDLNGNQLEGHVPRSLEKCKMLEVLNLGNNRIYDTFPFWLGNLHQLRILVLRSNKFHGTIGQPLINHTFPLLQIFDISSNNFTGSLPSNMFNSWKAMMEEGKSQSQFLNKSIGGGYYQDKVTVVSKGLQMELVKILIAFTTVDLSNNQFHGSIPEMVGDLKSLHVLNMSYNRLIGQIPKSLGNIKDLESLDLSQNDLSGEIPQQLTKLTFLAVLNLSQNHLIGSIPQNQQFLTFTNESFQGNLGLCGPPLSRKCGDTKVLLPLIQSESKYDWRSVWIGFGVGYGVGMGILFWTLALWTNGKKKYIKFIDRMILLIFPYEALCLMHQH